MPMLVSHHTFAQNVVNRHIKIFTLLPGTDDIRPQYTPQVET